MEHLLGASTGGYAVPRLPKPLPAFSLAPARDAEARPSIFSSLPVAGDLETLRQQLAQVCQEVDRSHAQVAEHLQEKELLVAERTQIIINLQGLTGLLSHGRAARAQPQEDIAAEALADRVARLRNLLPEGNSVRRLCEESELQPHIQGLSRQLEYLWGEWEREARGLRQAVEKAQADADTCRDQLLMAAATAERHASAAAQAEAAAQHKVEALECALRQHKDEAELRLSVMREQVQGSQQDAAAAQLEARHLKAQLERAQQQLMEASKAPPPVDREALQQLVVLRQQLQAVEARREQEAAQARQEQDVMQTKISSLQEENARLQAVLHEAERQLLLVRDDMVTVKRRQVELSGKLIKHPQATQRK